LGIRKNPERNLLNSSAFLLGTRPNWEYLKLRAHRTCPRLNGAAERACREGMLEVSVSGMNVLDLLKATIGCGLTAYLIYSFPVIGQVLIITILSLLWLLYARQALIRRR